MEKEPQHSSIKDDVTPPLGSDVVDESADELHETSDASHMPHGIALVVILFADLLAVFLVALDMTIVTTAIPRITDEFHSLDQVGWYGSAFFLTLACFQSFWGKLYTYMPVKRIFLVCTAIFEVGSVLCAASQSSTMLIAGRAIQGWGAAGVISGCYVIISLVVSPERRAAWMGMVGVVFGLASVAGPLVGGAFTEYVSWRWCFYINLPVGGVALLLILLLLRTPKALAQTTTKELLRQLDFPGLVFVLSSLICFILFTEVAGAREKWSSSIVIGEIVGFVLLGVVFAVIEYFSGEHAALVPRILKSRPILVSASCVFFQNGANFLMTYFIPIFFQSIDGVSAAESGVRNLPLIVGGSLFAAISGVLIGYVGYYTPFLIVGSAIFTIGGGLFYTLDAYSESAEYIGYQLLLGIGQGLCIQIPVITAQAFSAPADIPKATSAILFFQMMGGAIFVAAGQCVFNNRLVYGVVHSTANLDVASVLLTGAGDLRTLFSDNSLSVVLSAYLDGLKATFIFGTAIAAFAALLATTAPFRSIKGAATTSSAAA